MSWIGVAWVAFLLTWVHSICEGQFYCREEVCTMAPMHRGFSSRGNIKILAFQASLINTPALEFN